MLLTKTPRTSSRPPATASIPEKILLTMPEACQLLSMSRCKIYDLIRRGLLRTVKIGAGRHAGVRFRPVDLREFAERNAK